jgi:hypothetical protein
LQWNLLNYPAIVFPVGVRVGVADAAQGLYKEHEYPADYKPMSEADGYNYDLWREYGAQGYAGAPVSLQLVGRMYVMLLSSITTIVYFKALAGTIQARGLGAQGIEVQIGLLFRPPY